MRGRILVGTASWSDPEFVRDWYPPKMPAQERLRYYAQRFELVEINSTFYSIPEERQVEQWARAAPPGFVFDVKVHKLLSRHSCTARMLPPDLRGARGDLDRKLTLTPDLERQVAERFLEAIASFAEVEKIGALLLQLSPAFSPRANSLDELAPLFEMCSPHQVAVELRNRNWVEPWQLEKTLDFLSRRRVTLVSVDARKAFISQLCRNLMRSRILCCRICGCTVAMRSLSHRENRRDAIRLRLLRPGTC